MARHTFSTTIFNPPIDPGPWWIAHDFIRLVLYMSAVWVPLVFLAYAAGRRRVGLWFFFALTTVEAIALLIGIWIYQQRWTAFYTYSP